MQPDQNQYNFIMNPGTNNSSGPNFLRDPKKRIFVAIAFVSFVVLIAIILVGVFLSLTSKSSAGIKDVVAYQTEILRVSEIGLKDSTDNSIKAKIASLQSFMASDLAKATKSSGKLSKEELAKYQDDSVDKALVSAKATNTFDSVIIQQLDELLAEYQEKLEGTYDSSSNETTKIALNTANNNVVIYQKL